MGRGRGRAGAAFKNTEEIQQMLAWPLLLSQTEPAGLRVGVWPAKETVVALASDDSAGSPEGTRPCLLEES